MSLLFKYLLAMTCVIPSVAGIVKIRKIDSRFRLFIAIAVLDIPVETICFVNESKGNLAVNIYLLVSFILILGFISSYGFLRKSVMYVLGGIAVIITVVNFKIEGSFFNEPFYYLVSFISSVLLCVFIEILSKLITDIKSSLVNNCWFWISCFFILYYAYSLLLFGIYYFTIRNEIANTIGLFWVFVNAFCNLLFAIAIYKIPIKTNGANHVKRDKYFENKKYAF